MSVGTDYLPVATAAGANVQSQADYAGSGPQTVGVQVGIANPQVANKMARQPSVVAAALTTLIANTLSTYVSDDGNVNALATLIQDLIESLAVGAAGSPSVISVAYSDTPVFDCSLGNQLMPVFHITLTGNVTSSTLINMLPGMKITFHIVQDGTGGHSFVPPASVPMGTIDPTAVQINTQTFDVTADGTTTVASTPLMLNS